MYGRLSTQYYDLDKPTPPRDALAFFVQRAREHPGRILEPMCGSGRFLIPIARAGFAIDGVDSSPSMLAACRRKARALAIDTQLHLQAIEELHLPERYSMIMIPSGSLNLLVGEETLTTALECLCRQLQPDGALYCEILERSILPENPETGWRSFVRRPDGARIQLDGHVIAYRPEEGIVRSLHTYRLEHRGRIHAVETEDFILRYHDRAPFLKTLEEAGFADATVIPSYDPGTPGAGPAELLLIRARRKT